MQQMINSVSVYLKGFEGELDIFMAFEHLSSFCFKICRFSSFVSKEFFYIFSIYLYFM